MTQGETHDVGDPPGALGGELRLFSFPSLSLLTIDDVYVIWPTGSSFTPPLCTTSHADVPSRFKIQLQPTHLQSTVRAEDIQELTPTHG